MGCPARHVTGGQSGSALMRDLDHALSLIDATVARGVGAGDAQDAARLGRSLDQRARARAPRRRCRRAPDHRAWPHALPVLQGPRRLGRGARGQGQRLDPGRRQRRHRDLRRRRSLRSRPPAPMRSWSGRAAQGRPWLPGQIARYLDGGRARGRAAARDPIRASSTALYDEMLAHHGCAIGLRHARKHLGWALDAAAETAGIARRVAQGASRAAC